MIYRSLFIPLFLLAFCGNAFAQSHSQFFDYAGFNTYWNGSNWASYSAGYGHVLGTVSSTGDFTFYSTGNAASAGLTRTLTPVASISAAGAVSASSYYGDGSHLTGITAAPGGTTTQVQYNNGGSLAGSGVYYVSSTGYLGIGIAPGSPLHVHETTNQNILFQGHTNGAFNGAAGIVALNDANNAYVPMGFFATNYAFLGGGKVGINTTLPSSALDIEGGGLQVTDWNAVVTQGAHLQWNRTNGDGATWLVNQKGGGGGGIRFGESDISNTFTERMRIDYNGNVGIGTTMPQYTLDVNGLAQAQGLQVSNTGEYQGMSFYQGGALKFQIVNANSWVTSILNADMRDMRFAISSTEVMRIVSNSGPRLGVGTPWPTTTLDVSGTSSATNFKTAGTLQLGVYSSQPVACAAGYKGMVAMSNTLNDLCLCNGTSWVRAGSGGTACAW